LRSARYLLLAGLMALFAFAWLEPDRLELILIASALLVAVAAFAPGPPRDGIPAVSPGPQPSVWPDNSMRQVADALASPACILDSRGRMRFANERAIAAFGAIRLGEPASYHFRSPEFGRMFELAVASASRQAAEYQEAAPPQRWLRATIAPVGRAPVQFLLLTIEDFSSERLAEQMRSDFVANASHELRTPLASLRGFIETIRGPAAKDRKSADRFLGVMQEQAERMSRLIDDLLSLSRVEMKVHMPPERSANLAEVVRSVANAMAPLAGQQGVELVVDLPKQPLNVRGEPDELFQVCQNLVENACKYGQSGGSVELGVVSVTDPANSAEVAEVFVRDHGPGISAEHLPRLTERFYRVDIADSRQKQGTGLGLAIVKHMLARHRTRLDVASKPGEGARFSFRLPLEGEK
jgi:two-component system phosphate regulon sensor histidine kinase PhoR